MFPFDVYDQYSLTSSRTRDPSVSMSCLWPMLQLDQSSVTVWQDLDYYNEEQSSNLHHGLSQKL